MVRGHDYKNVPMRRLGFLSLDPNTKTDYKARELKGVFINDVCRYIRVIIKDCHKNQLNVFNQVGFAGLNIIGDPSPQRGGMFPVPMPSASAVDVSAAWPPGDASSQPPADSTAASPPLYAGQSVLCMDHTGRVWLSQSSPPGTSVSIVGVSILVFG
jgi:hypothetical protein